MESRIAISKVIYIILIGLSSLNFVTEMMYLPSLPSIVASLETTKRMVQLSLPIFLLGVSISHLFNGPLSDQIGRRRPILFGLFLCEVGTILCYFAPSILILLIGRLLEGIGVGACIVVFRSTARDLLAKNDLARFFSQVGMFDIFIIGASLLLGGYIKYHATWREVFLVIFIYTSIIWILAWIKLPETNRFIKKNIQLRSVLLNFYSVIKNPTFLGYALCVSGAFTGLTVYQVIGPFLLQETIGLSSIQFGWLGALIAFIIFISAFVNNRYVKRYGYRNMLISGVFFMMTGGILMLILAYIGFLNAYAVIIPVIIFDFGFGLTFINGVAGALEVFPESAGTAGAILGFIQICLASIVSAVIVIFPTTDQIPLGWMYLLIGAAVYINLRLSKIIS